MRHRASTELPARQRGAALLILFVIISMGVIFALVAGLNRGAGDLARARDQKTYAALAQAKEALIAYAVTYADDPTHANRVPGFLPCPDLESSLREGAAAPLNCGGSLVSVMGRLPWKTLGLEALKDGSGECLWYAVSGTYKNYPNGVSGTMNSNMMNWDTNGQFRVFDTDTNGNSLAGSTEDNRAVAVIFAPGGALKPTGASAVQDRSSVAGTAACGGNYSAANYLELFDANKNKLIDANEINNSVISSTASAVSAYVAGVAGVAGDTFNDRLVYISRADIWNAIKRRTDFNNHLRSLTRLAAECIVMFGKNNQTASPQDMRLPWASNVSLSTTSVPTYAVNASYDDLPNLTSGRLPFRVNNARNKTKNKLSSSISDSSTSGAYLFTSGSYCNYTDDQMIWYEHWKDQLFYAVASNFKPSANDSPMDPCPTCLKVNRAGTTLAGDYAAVVIFAGEKLSGQSRGTATDKGSIANYLEPPNSTDILADSGGGNYRVDADSSFNDIVYAIDTNLLAVKCYSAGSLTMVSVPVAAVAPPGNLAAYAACP